MRSILAGVAACTRDVPTSRTEPSAMKGLQGMETRASFREIVRLERIAFPHQKSRR